MGGLRVEVLPATEVRDLAFSPLCLFARTKLNVDVFVRGRVRRKGLRGAVPIEDLACHTSRGYRAALTNSVPPSIDHRAVKIFNDVLEYCGDSGKNDQVGSFILLTNLVASGDTTPELKVSLVGAMVGA